MKKLAAALIASAFTIVAFAQDKTAPAAPAAPAMTKTADTTTSAKKPIAKKHHHKSAKKSAAKPAA